MEQLAGSAVPDPGVVDHAWRRASHHVQHLVMTDSTMGPKARALGLQTSVATETESGWQHWLPGVEMPSVSLPSLPSWAADEASETPSEGWTGYLTGVERGFKDGFMGKNVEGNAVVNNKNRDALDAVNPELEPPARTLQVDLVSEMLGLGYDQQEDGELTRNSTYGGWSGIGDHTSDGEGRTRVAAGTRDPVRPVAAGDPPQTTWVGAGGHDYGVGAQFDYVDDSTPSYSCVGAVSVALEAGGVYESGDAPLDGRQDVTHGKSGDRSEVMTGGGRSKRLTMENLMNIADFPNKGSVVTSIRRDHRVLEDARERVQQDGTLGGITDDEERAAAILRAAYDVLVASDQRDERLAGSAAALQHAGLGTEVNPADAKPGDVSQQWAGDGGGHSTVVHVVQGHGNAKVDDAGFVSAQGRWVDGSFYMDQDTDPALVGVHRVVNVRMLGAHSRGSADYNRDEQADGGHGIFTNEGHKPGDKRLEFYGRPNNSAWYGWTPSIQSVEEALQSEAPAGALEMQKPDEQSWSEWAGRKARQLGNASGLTAPSDKKSEQ
ncbi:MAG: hypothetical protein ACI855_003507 [Myxococcota bacterium]|jgi:hypothetical protein